VDYRDRIQLDKEVLRIRERLSEDTGEDPRELDFYAEPLVSEWLRVKEPDSDEEESVETDLPKAESWVQARFGDTRVWLISPGEGARHWRAFQEDGIVAMGWDYLGDLTEYGSREEVQAVIAEKEGKENPIMVSLAVWQFAHEMAEGDVVVAKRGRGRLLGWGRITGPYEHDPDRSEYRNLRSVRWETVGDWVLPSDLLGPAKTLTEIKKYPRMVRRYFQLMEGESEQEADGSVPDTYSVKDATEDLFLEPEEFGRILDTLGRKKNVVLQGPPGVGKTYMARKLAWALIGRKDPTKVGFVQFHQSYAYEDFVQGWRPNEQGGFQLHHGAFHRFCTRAREDGGNPHVFIIDEINRANLSRAFGELMMLVEGDKRGPSHAIPLTYSPDESFYVPENVHVVGLMNTADRSLALVDYALRRRFSFVDLEPAFGRDRFMSYLVEVGVPEALVNRIDGRMRELNDAIRRDRRNLGPGFEVGHSYFVPGPEDQNLDDAWYTAIVETEVAPLLREYWFDRPDQADDHIRRLRQ
jgi:5-methylcytosine-specific restriction enzyme B